MPYQHLDQPVPGPEAFRATGDNARLSQAAILLLLGPQMRGDDYALEGRAAAADLQPAVEVLPREDLERFPVPRVRTGGRPVGAEHARFFPADRFGPTPVWFDHSATHDPGTWAADNVPNML